MKSMPSCFEPLSPVVPPSLNDVLPTVQRGTFQPLMLTSPPATEITSPGRPTTRLMNACSGCSG